MKEIVFPVFVCVVQDRLVCGCEMIRSSWCCYGVHLCVSVLFGGEYIFVGSGTIISASCAASHGGRAVFGV